MLVITAIVGDSFRNERSLSSASATMYSPRPEPRVAAEGAEPAADHGGRVEARALEHQRDHRRRRRLAVRAGDGDAEAQAHQLGQHLGARNHRHAARAGLDDLGVRRPAPPTRYTTTSASPTCAARVPDVHRHAQRRQPIGHVRPLLVRSRSPRSRDSPAVRRCRSCRCRRSRRSASRRVLPSKRVTPLLLRAIALGRDRGRAASAARAAARRRPSAAGAPDRRASAEHLGRQPLAASARAARAPSRRADAARAPRRSSAGGRRSPSAAAPGSPAVPAAVSSASVVAPARQTTRSARRHLAVHLVEERLDAGVEPGRCVAVAHQRPGRARRSGG